MRFLFIFLCLASATLNLTAQNNVVDKIIAVVGEEVILKSDVENAFLSEQAMQYSANSNDFKADILEQLLTQKLLLAQAKVDSIVVTESDVENQLDQTIKGYIANAGSLENVERFFKKDIEGIKADLRNPIREQIIAMRMRDEVTSKVRITPSEVRSFYKTINKDSLPEIPDKYELQQIVIKPKVSDAEKQRIREQLQKYREQIINKEKSFATLAVLYSACPSAARGGELGYSAKAKLDPAFADAAFNLKPGAISKIVESEFGFHIIQLIDRKGVQINVRHILLRPKISTEAKEQAISRLDSIRDYILKGDMTFEQAALYFSQDKQSRNNGGLIAADINGTKETKIAKSHLPGEIAKVVNQMETGDISKPFEEMLTGQEEFKVIKFKKHHPKHIANLDEDWAIFERMLLNTKKMNILDEWVADKRANTYIHIDNDYKNEKFKKDGWIK